MGSVILAIMTSQESEDFSKFLLGTPWDAAQDTDWLPFDGDIRRAKSMKRRSNPLSGKSLLEFLTREDASEDFREALDKKGFMYYKLFTISSLQTQEDQREKLHKTKRFEKHIGILIVNL